MSKQILNEMLHQLKDNLFDKWYPKAVDYEEGGYFSNLSYNFDLLKDQEKMIVTQARHIWTLSKASEFFNNEDYKQMALYGLRFLKEKMWDNNYGGFYQIRDRFGNTSSSQGWMNEKRVYGNAYGLFGLSALYNLTKNNYVLNFAEEVFNWIESNSHDKVNGGYFQFFKENNEIFGKDSDYKSIANDLIEAGYKDQNSSIHLLEAFTELYNIHKMDILQTRLTELLLLIRDKITTKKGYLNLFFDYEWNPVSFKNSTAEIREANYRLDHVSFGHDYETAFLMLEASHALGIKDDTKTLIMAKRMADHALKFGWDKEYGGFYDEGYYFEGENDCRIIKDSKNWWAQAEALNIYLMLSKIFPEEKIYYETFMNVWEYIKKYIIDNENGGWYWGGLDKEPNRKYGQKGEIWKSTYHNGRALMNCIAMLADEDFDLYKSSPGFRNKKVELDKMISKWKSTANKIDK